MKTVHACDFAGLRGWRFYPGWVEHHGEADGGPFWVVVGPHFVQLYVTKAGQPRQAAHVWLWGRPGPGERMDTGSPPEALRAWLAAVACARAAWDAPAVDWDWP